MEKVPYLPKIRCVINRNEPGHAKETKRLTVDEWLDENQELFEWVV